MLPDPCPLPDTVKRRGLAFKERLIYAPMADVGGVLYDKDAVYVDIPDWKVQYSRAEGGGAAKGPTDAEGAERAADEGEAMVRGLQAVGQTLDEALAESTIRIYPKGKALRGGDAMDVDGDEDEGEEDEGEDGDEEDGQGSDWSDDEGEEEDADAQGEGAAGCRLLAAVPE